MKRIIILFISIFVLLIVYVSTPSVSEEQMRTLFYEYIQRTFKEEYKKFKIISDVDLTVPGNQYHRGYAGYGKTYSIEYVHKEYKWIFIELCTNGNNIVCDNKNNIKKEFKYNKIFNEYFINAFKIVGVEPVGIIVEMNGSINEYEHVDEIKPNLEFIIKNPKYFKPQIKVNTSLVSLKEFEKLNYQMSEIFDDIEYYDENDADISYSAEDMIKKLFVPTIELNFSKESFESKYTFLISRLYKMLL